MAANDVTGLLTQWSQAASGSDQRLMEAIHDELRRLARSYLRRERRDHTLQPTALVNEAYLRLVKQRHVRWTNRSHFFGIAARVMRRILVDHARRGRAAKRGGRDDDRFYLCDQQRGETEMIDVLALHQALSYLATLDRRQAEIVEMHYFGGLTREEIAELFDISATTVKRELATGRLWLRHRIST